MTPEPFNEYQKLVGAAGRANVELRLIEATAKQPEIAKAACEAANRLAAALSALKLPHAGDDEIKRLRDMFETQAWAQDWQHNIVPSGKPAHELACAAIRALPKLLAAYHLHTPPAGVSDNG